ncbi:MAG TPA: helix-turn-helix transcriptional regulator [Myxococcota bacterium]|nr:helix-turn-helix transcriptional regulator [Myxococcota bacterium]
MGEQLTEAERRVAREVARGRTNHEVAEALRVSEKTVEWNLTKVYRKLAVRSRTELALKIQQLPRGEVPPMTTRPRAENSGTRKEAW